MARRIDPEFGPYDGILFLALWWAGGQDCTLSEIIGLYDWVNRDIPTAEDLDGQLVAAKDRLAKVEAALARARQALRATTATAVIPAAARTSRGEHEDEGEEHGD